LETVFLLPDLTPYLLIVFIAFNLAALFLHRDSERTGRWVRIRKSVIPGIIIAIVSLMAYVWTMMFIDSELRHYSPIGGVVQYQFPVGIGVVHVYQGYQQSTFMGASPDFAAWLLIVLLIFAVKLLRSKPNKS
jgi:hypothetical protein